MMLPNYHTTEFMIFIGPSFFLFDQGTYCDLLYLRIPPDPPTFLPSLFFLPF